MLFVQSENQRVWYICSFGQLKEKEANGNSWNIATCIYCNSCNCYGVGFYIQNKKREII